MSPINITKESSTISAEAKTVLPTKYGTFRMIVYVESSTGKEHVALIKGNLNIEQTPLIRIHSECLTGDVIHSNRCDCGEQLDMAFDRIESEGCGNLLYLR